jgi:hypothetical protein
MTLRDTATCQANYSRFLDRTIASGEAWILSGSAGVAFCESNDDEQISVILFFSDAAYARRAQRNFPGYEPKRIDLFDLIYRWLPGMSGDGVLAEPNWTGDLVGLEIDSLTMRQTLEATFRPEQQSVFRERYEQITSNDER